jgi:hypothetical protein
MIKPLTGGADLITEAWRNYLRHWTTYLEFIAWFAALSLASWGVDAVARSLTEGAWALTAIQLALRVPIMLFAVLPLVALIHQVAHHISGESAPIVESMSRARRRFWPFLWSSALVLLIVIAPLTVMGLVGMALVAGTLPLGWSLAALVAGLAMIAVAALLYIRYKLYLYQAVLTDLRPAAIVKSAAALGQARFNTVAWRIVVVAVFFYAVYSLINNLLFASAGLALGDAGLFFGGLDFEQGLREEHFLVMTVVPQLAAAIVLPLVTAAELRLWSDLRD